MVGSWPVGGCPSVSGSRKLGFALFLEGGHALPTVIAGGDGRAAERIDHGVPVFTPGRMYHPFRRLGGARGKLGNPCGNRVRGRVRVVGHLCGESDLKGTFSRKPASEENHLLQNGFGYQSARRCVPDQPGTIPTAVSGRAITAVLAMTRRSQAAANSSPPPKAIPFRIATVGLESRASLSNVLCPSRIQRRANSAGERSPQPLMSAPAQKARSPSPETKRHATSVFLRRSRDAAQVGQHFRGQGIQLRRVVDPEFRNPVADVEVNLAHGIHRMTLPMGDDNSNSIAFRTSRTHDRKATVTSAGSKGSPCLHHVERGPVPLQDFRIGPSQGIPVEWSRFLQIPVSEMR